MAETVETCLVEGHVTGPIQGQCMAWQGGRQPRRTRSDPASFGSPRPPQWLALLGSSSYRRADRRPRGAKPRPFPTKHGSKAPGSPRSCPLLQPGARLEQATNDEYAHGAAIGAEAIPLPPPTHQLPGRATLSQFGHLTCCCRRVPAPADRHHPASITTIAESPFSRTPFSQRTPQLEPTPTRCAIRSRSRPSRR